MPQSFDELDSAIDDFWDAMEETGRRGKAKIVWVHVLDLFGYTYPGTWPLWTGISFTTANQPQAESAFDSQSIASVESWVSATQTNRQGESFNPPP